MPGRAIAGTYGRPVACSYSCPVTCAHGTRIFGLKRQFELGISHHIPYAHVASTLGRPYRRPHPCPDGVYRRCRDPWTCGCILNRTHFSTPACANADPHGCADACPHGACCPTRTCCSRAPRSPCVAYAAAAARFTARLMPRSRYLCPLRLPPRRRRRLPLRCVLPHPHALHICRIHPPAYCLTVERHDSHLKHALPFSLNRPPRRPRQLGPQRYDAYPPRCMIVSLDEPSPLLYHHSRAPRQPPRPRPP